jgi:hypothetical protein
MCLNITDHITKKKRDSIYSVVIEIQISRDQERQDSKKQLEVEGI